MTGVLNQAAFRIRTDATAAQGGSPLWAASANVNAAVHAGGSFRIRFAVANTGASASVSLSAWCSVNGGAYSQISTTGAIVPADPTSGVSANGQVLITGYLTVAGSTFNGTGKYTTSGVASGNSIPASGYCEYEFGLLFNSPACDGNTYAIRLYEVGAPLSAYTNTPSFNMPNNAALAATEADDSIAAAGNVPRAARLNAIEVSDSLTGSATALWSTGVLAITEANDILNGIALAIPATAALAITEANDALIGSAFEIPVGGLWGQLAIVESRDVLAGLGTGSGDVGSLRAQEADDALVGAAGPVVAAILNATEDDDAVASSTMLWANQWVPSSGCAASGWIQITNPSEPIVIPPPQPITPPITPPSGTGEMLIMEQLNVLGVNSLSNFTHPPNLDLCQLTVDGRPFFPVGASPDFSVSGHSVTWLSTVYSVVPGSTVIASYSWTQ